MFNVPSAARARAQVADMLAAHQSRPTTVVAAIAALVAQWSLAAVDVAAVPAFDPATAGGTGDIVCVAGNATVTSAAGKWTAADAGKAIVIPGAAGGGMLASVIKAYVSAGSVTLATAPTTSGTFLGVWGTTIAQDSPAFDVRSFGAIGDGVADDTAAFQAAIDAAQENGRTVDIPAGTYRIDGTVHIAPQSWGFRIRGVGYDSVLLRSAGTLGPVLSITNPGGGSYFQTSRIESLQLYAETSAEANVGIQFALDAGTGPIVNFRAHDVMINNFAKSVENNCESNEINWYDCWFVSGGYGVYDNYGGADWRFFGCHFQALTNWAIHGQMSSVSIIGCTQQSYRDGAKGFYLADGRCHVIQGNYFEGEPNVGAVAMPPYPADGQSGVIGDGQSIAIQLAGTNRGGLIASNNFDMFYGRAIVVDATNGLEIVGNHFTKCQIGIQLSANAVNVEIGPQHWHAECVVPVSYDNPTATAQSLDYRSGNGTRVIGDKDLAFHDRDDYPSLPCLSVTGTLGAEVTPGGDAASTPEVNAVGSWVNYGGTLTTMASVASPTPPDGTYMLRMAGPNGAKGYLALTTVVGQVYRVTFKCRKEAGSPACVISDAAADTYSTATQRRHHFLTTTRGFELVNLTFVATATTTYLMFVMVGDSECFVDTLSVKPVTSGTVAAHSGEFTYLNGRKIFVGAPNSGGAGYRSLLLEN